MKCMKCGEKAFKSVTSEAIELGFGLLVIRNIPCYKCEVCDEILYTGDVVERIEAIVSEAKRLMQKIRVIEYDEAA
ncbi:MAG: YgiT-type zinc finger protein [Clostridia bacterium]|nr:YgiT-type zinc finger protein [Clostridia bacterium]